LIFPDDDFRLHLHVIDIYLITVAGFSLTGMRFHGILGDTELIRGLKRFGQVEMISKIIV